MERHAASKRFVTNECSRVRLAESAVAAVDLCDCGVVQVHVGPVTLRLTAEALSDLLGTLGEAVAMHPKWPSHELHAGMLGRRRRSDA